MEQPSCGSLLRIGFPRPSSHLSEFGNPDACTLRALSKPLGVGVRAVVREGSAQPLPSCNDSAGRSIWSIGDV